MRVVHGEALVNELFGPTLFLHTLAPHLLLVPLVLCQGIAIGGDSFPGSTLSDHCLRFQNIPQV